MLKVALVNPPQTGAYSQAPLGLALIAAVLEKAGYPVTVVDANALKLQPDQIATLVSDADVVGLTAMTPTINAAMAIARHLKKANPKQTIVLGGAHATLLPEETMAACPEIDVLVRGEGEETIIQLLPALEQKQPLDKIAGVSYRSGGKITVNVPREGNIELDSLPFLAYHLLPWQKYRPHPPHGRYQPFTAIITSRGCPYHCSYCSKPIFGNKFRGQSPERVVEEVAYHQKRFGIKEFAFYDDVFTLDKKRTHAICEGILKRGLKLHWTCETRVNLVDKELLRDMKQAGCYAVAYGIESGSQDVLNTLDKGITLAQVEEAVRLTREARIEAIGYFMIGSPGESPETIRQTIRFAQKLKLDFAQFAVTTPFPRTRLHELYLQGGQSREIPWESFIYAGAGAQVTPVFESGELDRNSIQRWASQAHKDFYLRPSYVWQRLRGISSFGDVKVNVKGLAMLLGNIRKS
ncbi:MAG: radical SAM protein [Dehalococcoidales bacterium]|nr:radical SAM protein [Dehalococcoidales bacterium]